MEVSMMYFKLGRTSIVYFVHDASVVEQGSSYLKNNTYRKLSSPAISRKITEDRLLRSEKALVHSCRQPQKYPHLFLTFNPKS